MSVLNSISKHPASGGSLNSGYNRIVKGKVTYTNSSAKILQKYGDKTIVAITVKRNKISPSAIIELAKTVSKTVKATFESKAYDFLFHLYMELALSDGTKITIEKIDVISITKNAHSRKDTEQVTVNNVPSVTLKQLLDNTKQHMGESKYWSYNAIKNNCQSFLMGVVTSNKILGTEITEFILQDVSGLIGKEIQGLLKGIIDTQGIITTIFD